MSRLLKKLIERTLVALNLLRLYLSNHIASSCLSSRLRLFWYRKIMRYHIGQGSSVLRDVRFARENNLEIGEFTVINNQCRLDNRKPIRIGNNVSISYDAVILTLGHDINSPDFQVSGGPVVIEDYVWIGTRAMIMPDVTIRRGAVVLPGAVVTGDVPEMAIVGGVPARIVGKRESSLSYQKGWDPILPLFG